MIILRDTTFKYHVHGLPDVNFEIANEDLAGDPQYFGYLAYNGSWIIQKRVIATGIYTYCAGTSDYAASFVARAGLTYVAFSAL